MLVVYFVILIAAIPHMIGIEHECESNAEPGAKRNGGIDWALDWILF